MFTPILQLLQKNSWKKNLLLVLCFSLMALYPIYSSYYRGLAVEQYYRHLDFIEKKSMFYNPWQYRALCPLLIEGTYQMYHHTVGQLFNIDEKVKIQVPGDTEEKYGRTQKLLASLNKPGFIEYTMIFVAFRFLEHLLIFALAFLFFRHFIRNQWLIFFGLIFISLSMGNSVNDSDLAFNTYMDVILYLFAGYVIVSRMNDWWIVPITIVGAFNRETSILIPILYFFSRMDINPTALFSNFKELIIPKTKVILITGISCLLFALIFAGIRWYYGYVPPTEWRVPSGLPMLKLNLFSSVAIKSYFEMFGTFAVLPLIFLYKFKKIDYRLRLFFIVLVPVWFFVHWWSVVAYQSRLYLVPTLLIFLPAFLEIIEKSIIKKQDYKVQTSGK